jgi:type I restriction enzyme M protein
LRSAKDPRWRYGVPPAGNANFAWVQVFVHHLSPRGTAGFVLANGSLSTSQQGEKEIRRRMIEADLVDCIIAMPPQLFYSTQIPVSLWFLTRDKSVAGRDRSRQTLFIDASRQGHLVDRTHRELSDEEISRMASTYHAWRRDEAFVAVAGFSGTATIERIAQEDYALTPGRYVAPAAEATDKEPAKVRLARLRDELDALLAEAGDLDGQIRGALRDYE